MRIPLYAIALLAAAALADPAAAQQNSFGARFKGGPYKAVVVVGNASCTGTHSVKVDVQGAPWLKITGTNPVQVGPGETVTVDAQVDLTTTALGDHSGTVQFTCLTCSATCGQDKTTTPITIKVIEPVPTFNGPQHPTDNQFGGLVNGQPGDICALIQKAIADVAATAWGTGPRGGAIVKKLQEEFADNNCSDISFVTTTDAPNDKGKAVTTINKVDDMDTLAGNGVYVRTLRVWFPEVYSEEIYIGLDQTSAGIECARQNPAAYYVFTYQGRLGVFKKEDLVHLLFHEGLHAVNGGKHNVLKTDKSGTKGASLEEEQDGFKAGDQACVAVGLPPTGNTAGPGYNSSGSNPAYTPLK